MITPTDDPHSRFLSCTPKFRCLWCRLRSLADDTRGSVAVLSALIFPVLLGGAGLGAETGYWYFSQREIQHASDISAHAAAVRKRAGDKKSEVEATALRVAIAAGFTPSIGTITVHTPPQTGPNTGNQNFVEVVLSESPPRLFSSIFTKASLTLRGRAVAHISGGSSACVLALSPNKSAALNVSGSASLKLEGCAVASNSSASDSFLMSGGSASLSADCLYTVGQAAATTRLTLTRCEGPKEQAPVVLDPYGSVPEPAVTGPCRNKNVGTPTTSTTLTPSDPHPSGVPVMRFCGGLDIKGKVTLNPGLYIVDGGSFTVNGGNTNSTSDIQISGSGVTVFLANKAVAKLSGNETLNLSAPTKGPFSGLLFFGDRSATGVSHKINGTSGSTLQGAIYAAGSAIEFSGNSAGSDGCTQVIADTVSLTGNSVLQSKCASAGTKDVLASQRVKVIE